MKLINIMFLMLALLVSCSQNKDSKNAGDADNEMRYSKLLRMYSPEAGVTVAEVVDPWDSTRVAGKYVLLEEGKKAPDGFADATAISVPVKNIVAFSSVHAAALDELGHIDVVKGVADASYFKLKPIVDGLASGKVVDIGLPSSPSAEKVIDLDPQGIVLNLYEGMDISAVEKVGVPLIKFAENMEQSPLGRAEWIKLLGALTGEKEKADSIFASVEKRYEALCTEGKRITKKPKVLADNMYNGVWYISGGGSYQAHMIADAGGIWPWRDDTSTGSLNLSYEQVLDKAEDADIWMIKGFDPKMTRKSLIASDPRYAHFAAVDNGGVWYCDSSTSDIFESTPFHPDLLLAEYIAIFTGDISKTRYFKPIDRE